MSDLLPDQPALRVTQVSGTITPASLSDIDHLLVVLPHRPAAVLWRQLPDGERLRQQWQHSRIPEKERRVHSRLHNRQDSSVTLAALPEPWSDSAAAYPEHKFAADLAATVLAARPRRLAVAVLGIDEPRLSHLQQGLVLAFGAGAFQLPEFRRQPPKTTRLQQLRLLGSDSPIDIGHALAGIEASNLARWLTALPSNKLTASAYRELIAQLAEHHDWSMRFLDMAALRRLGAGAFLSVAQGNATADAGIVHLSWRPAGRSRPDVALVGKGVIFDTGGTNLKPFRAMLDMHQDMCGSAVALGVLLAVTRLKLPLAVDCWLAITENRIGPHSGKPRDIVTAADGTTIEVIHTDAEGRMILADTLALSAREKPRLLIDYATLTGQCINALTERYSGVFSNRSDLAQRMVAAGRDCGERVWPFPMDEDFDEDLKSSVADVAQCSVENAGDHILAARFLRRFVPETIPWIHLDLSSASHKKGLGTSPPGPTGFGVRLTLSLLADWAGDIASPGEPPRRR